MVRLSKLSETAKHALLLNIGAFENYLYTEYNCGRNKQCEEFKSQEVELKATKHVMQECPVCEDCNLECEKQ